ncbi:AbfB domain-containing protein [Crossiella sp. CA198]|uniref:AbfB domain-containing protein n=1 Tax=Crossiella sp. CA198 TaxID=3455607 RepID=UPI003F8D515C
MARAKLSKTAVAGALAASVVTGLLGALPAHAISGGTPVATGGYSYSAYLRVGAEKSCSGVLVDEQWVLTAASCFGTPGQVRPGAPAERTVVTVGRAKLSHGEGAVSEASQLVPHADRNLVLVKLVDPVPDTWPARMPTASGFATGEQLTVTGYGALAAASEEADRLHSATFPLGSQAGSTLTLGSGGAEICAGDLGGPVIRQRDGNPELGAILVTAPRRNCLGETETSDATTAVRVDDLTDWIKQQVLAGRANPVITDGGVVTLKNQISGWCLRGELTAECGSGRSEEEFEIVGSGEYRKLRNLYTQQCLTTVSSSVTFMTCGNVSAQDWAITPGKNGTVQLRNQGNLGGLAVPSLDPGARPVLRDGSRPYDYQLWQLTAKGKVRHDLPQRASLRATNAGLADHYLRHARGAGWLSLITASSPELDKADATFDLVPGLADSRCYSLQARDIRGAYLRHANGRLRLDDNNGTPLFANDATWCARDSAAGNGVSFASFNFPDNYLRHINGEVWNAYKGGAQWYETPNSFEADTSWAVAPPLKP